MDDSQKDLIEIHLRTYRSALQSSNEIDVSSLIPTYIKMNPLLHSKAGSTQEIDEEALSYAVNRFPKEILKTNLIVIGQTREIFTEAGYDLSTWKEVKASHRKRKTFFDPKTKTLACFASSISDIDDIVNLTIALQIELEKIIKQNIKPKSLEKEIEIPSTVPDFKLKLLSGTWVNFAKTAQEWWKTIMRKVKPKVNLADQPLVFVSSNNHSLINLLDGFCIENKERIHKIIKSNFPEVQKEIDSFNKNNGKDKLGLCGTAYCAYFASQFALSFDKKLREKKAKNEERLGIIRIPPGETSFLETQVIPGKLISPKLKDVNILNIEYPLGFAAYHILEELLENVKDVLGIYVLGKAAALNTKMGDILIPKVVFDEHTQNTYMIKNSFNKNFPYKFESGSVLDNQKLVSVLGSFLENKALFDLYSEREFNIIEMEAGPYLGAITQATYPKSLPQGTIVDLTQPPFDLGLIYYSSDSPYILSQTLGEFMGIAGVEATYLATKAIIERIKKISLK